MFIRRVIGTSMLPTYSVGAILFAWRHPQPQVGDVVIVARDGQEMVKRVARIEPQGYFLLGDNPAASTDSRTYGLFPASAIKGVVKGSIA